MEIDSNFMELKQKAYNIKQKLFRQPVKGIELEEFFPSPLEIPESKSNNIKIRKFKISTDTPIISMRQAITRGIRPINLVCNPPITVTELSSRDDGVWMTDLPEELHQIAEMLKVVKPRGNILVGGLGLGIVTHFLRRNKHITNIRVIEQNEDIIKLVSDYLPYNVEVIHGDIKDYLQNEDVRHNFYLLDTWQGTGEATWWEDVFPLKRIIRNKWGREPTIHCWAEDIMMGQVIQVLVSEHRHWFYKNLPEPMTENQIIKFYKNIGTEGWEKKYGSLTFDPY